MNYLTIDESNKTISIDAPEVIKLMIVRKELVSDLSITLGSIEPEIDTESIDKKDMEMIARARQEYRKGEVISEKELFKRLEKDANRDEWAEKNFIPISS